MLVITGEQPPAAVFDKLFSSKPIANSLRNLLRRGGMIYIGPVSWGILAHTPKSMKDFFKTGRRLPPDHRKLQIRKNPNTITPAYRARQCHTL